MKDNKKDDFVITMVLLALALMLYFGVHTYNLAVGNYTVTSYGTCTRAENGKICSPWYGRGSVYIPDSSSEK